MPESESRTELARGEELFYQGDLEAAKACFLRLVEGPDPSKEAFNNLGVIAHQKGDLDEALRCFTEALLIDCSYKDAVANYSTLLNEIRQSNAEKQKNEQALTNHEAPPGSKKQYCTEQTSQPGRKARIAILCLPGLENFLEDIVRYLEKRYEVRTCYSRDGGELSSAVQWADLVWLEWANELAVELTRKLSALRERKVICRAHRYEIFRPFFKEIQWEVVDKLIFVADFMRDFALQVVPDLEKRTSTHVIYNGIDTEKFRFEQRGPGYNLAIIGYIHSRKNPYFWPMIVSKLKAADRRYTLHVAGKFQEAECQLYLEHMIRKLNLEKSIKFHGYQNNIHEWLEDKNYLLATSVHESFGYTIGEAMAMGIRPIVHWFPGADELWPEECLFTTIEDVVSMVLDINNYDSEKYRRVIEERYDIKKQLNSISLSIAKLFMQNEKTIFGVET